MKAGSRIRVRVRVRVMQWKMEAQWTCLWELEIPLQRETLLKAKCKEETPWLLLSPALWPPIRASLWLTPARSQQTRELGNGSLQGQPCWDTQHSGESEEWT